MHVTEAKEFIGQAEVLLKEAGAVYTNPEATQENLDGAKAKIEEARKLKERVAEIKNIEQVALEMSEFDSVTPEKGRQSPTAQRSRSRSEFKSMGEFLIGVDNAGNPKVQSPVHRELLAGWFKDADEPKSQDFLKDVPYSEGKTQRAWEDKTLVENIGADGGFLVPVEFMPTLLSAEWERNIVRTLAVKIPMRRRQIDVPALDMSATTEGEGHQYGGVVVEWTEEATEKDETQPKVRQIQLVAHKLSAYTEASTELLADSAIGLEPLLGRLMGGAVNWEEDWAFLRGTGAGQPLGVVHPNCGGTFVEPRAIAGTVVVDDLMQMLMHHHGSNPYWHISRSSMATLYQLNGPAANPSYVFMPGSVVNKMPPTLLGYPIEWTEKLPALGNRGDFLLADWGYYYIGDRQSTTIDSSSHYRFRYNLIAWRVDHRVDGQPMLRQPWTIADGNLQISPFVILGDAAS